jgi:putative ABC transport system permease protein
MKLFDLVRKELWHRRSRLISGLLIITLGTAIVVAIHSISVVSERAVAVQLDNLGANILVLPQGANIDDYYTADIDAPTFSENAVNKIMSSALPGMDNLSPKLTRRIAIGNEKLVLTGILPKNEIASKPIWQKSGLRGKQLVASCAAPKKEERTVSYKDKKLQRHAVETLAGNDCFIGSSAARKLHKREQDSLEISGRNFHIAKVLPETGTVDDDRIFANLHVVQELLGTGTQISSIEIMGCCNEISDGLLAKLRNVVPEARITTIGQIVSTQLETNRMLQRIMYAFLLIIVVVGAVSIGNYMWSNVNERKKEIGVLRLIGYSKKNIYFMLLSKAAVLGFIGGVIGYLVGSLAALWLGPMIVHIEVSFLPFLLPVAMLTAIFTAILGSVIPAYKAGKIEPFTNLQEV